MHYRKTDLYVIYIVFSANLTYPSSVLVSLCCWHTSYFEPVVNHVTRDTSIESSKTKSVYICIGSLYCVRFVTIAFFTVGAVLTY